MKVEIDYETVCNLIGANVEINKKLDSLKDRLEVLEKLEHTRRISNIDDTSWLKEDGSLYSVHDTSRKIKALGEERDWWRAQAFDANALLDRLTIPGKIYTKHLKMYARSVGLEVPE